MGYQTWYQLHVSNKVNEIASYMEGMTHLYLSKLTLPWPSNNSGAGTFEFDDRVTWYEHDEDIKELSKIFPDVVFILDGDGDGSADIWRSFYKNGLSYHWVLDYGLPEFDETQLSEH